MRRQSKRKMDPRLVSTQRWEIAYIARKFGVSWATVRRIRKAVGRSRIKIYATLRSPSRLIS